MKYLYLSIAAILLLFTACQRGHDSHQGKDEHHLETKELELTLNDGQRWQMDDHTRSVLKDMTESVEADGDIKTIGQGLQADLDKLIQGCTMEGEAHDQLHVFLTAFIPAVQKVATEGSVESLQAVKKLLQTYPKYFE